PAVWAGPGGGVPYPGGVVRFVGRVGRTDVRLTGATAATSVEQAEAGATWPGEIERLRRTGGELETVGGPVEMIAPPPAAAPAAPRPAPPPAAGPTSPPAGPPPGTAEAAGWGLALLAVGVLFARFPRATWPEQAAALAGLFGQTVAGAPAVGLAVYAAARGVWLADRLRGGR
ncbi:MAG TPA: hypothetical protein VH092_35945, partial [Urbifossiella sp.]|nr:hypothetical protein [Urbifossiella sp.]